MDINLIEILWNKTSINKETGCWLYGEKNDYVLVTYNGTSWVISRLSLCIYFKLPYKGKWVACHIDELCSNKNCWNPAHLYKGTAQDNIQDSIKRGTQKNIRKFYCPKGHLYDFIDSNGARRCRRCYNELARKNRKLRKDKEKR